MLSLSAMRAEEDRIDDLSLAARIFVASGSCSSSDLADGVREGTSREGCAVLHSLLTESHASVVSRDFPSLEKMLETESQKNV
jgi:hypothetical protein